MGVVRKDGGIMLMMFPMPWVVSSNAMSHCRTLKSTSMKLTAEAHDDKKVCVFLWKNHKHFPENG